MKLHQATGFAQEINHLKSRIASAEGSETPVRDNKDAYFREIGREILTLPGLLQIEGEIKTGPRTKEQFLVCLWAGSKDLDGGLGTMNLAISCNETDGQLIAIAADLSTLPVGINTGPSILNRGINGGAHSIIRFDDNGFELSRTSFGLAHEYLTFNTLGYTDSSQSLQRLSNLVDMAHSFTAYPLPATT